MNAYSRINPELNFSSIFLCTSENGLYNSNVCINFDRKFIFVMNRVYTLTYYRHFQYHSLFGSRFNNVVPRLLIVKSRCTTGVLSDFTTGYITRLWLYPNCIIIRTFNNVPCLQHRLKLQKVKFSPYSNSGFSLVTSVLVFLASSCDFLWCGMSITGSPRVYMRSNYSGWGYRGGHKGLDE